MKDRTAETLRHSFDRTFAEPAISHEEETVDLLVVDAGPRRLALRLRQVRGIRKCPRAVPVPSDAPGLVGLGAVRGELIALYGLAPLVCHPPVAPEPGDWVVLCGAAIGLVFDALHRQIRVPASALMRAGPDARAPHSDAWVEVDGERWRVLDIPSLLGATATHAGGTQRGSPAPPGEERA